MSAAQVLPAPGAPRLFTTREILRNIKVTRRQLQWWDEHLIVVPLIVGHTRWYSHAQLVQIAVLAELRRKGMSIQEAKTFLKPVQRWINNQQFPEYLVIPDSFRCRAAARKASGYILGDRSTAYEAAYEAACSVYVVALLPIYDAIERISK